MKHKLSITVEEDIILKVFDAMRTRQYRNKSHFFEVAAMKMLEKGELK